MLIASAVALASLSISIFAQVPKSASVPAESHTKKNFPPSETYNGDKTLSAETEVKELLAMRKDHPNDPLVYNNLAVVYFHLGQLKNAYSAISDSVKINPTLVTPQLNRSMITQHLGQREESLAASSAAVKIAPLNRKARRFACLLKLTYEMDKDALECYRKYSTVFAPAPEVKENLGETLYRNGYFKEARDILNNVLQSNPRNVVASNILAKTYYRLKNYKKGAQLLKNAVERYPDQPELRFNLAMCYLAQNNRPAVLSQYKLLKSMDEKLADKLYRIIYRNLVVDVRQYKKK